jgi:hypothetical protein
MTGASMANGTAPKAPARIVREIPHTVSPGLWALAWKRLRSDNVGMVSLVIVAAFILLMIASATGLIAGDWAKETGVNYAPPSFIGADIEGGAPAAPVTPAGSSAPAVEFKSEVVDPLADVLAEIKGDKKGAGAAEVAPPADAGKSVVQVGDEVWLVLPNTKNPIRVPKSHRLKGGFSAADMARLSKDDPQADSFRSETPQREVTIGYQLAYAGRIFQGVTVAGIDLAPHCKRWTGLRLEANCFRDIASGFVVSPPGIEFLAMFQILRGYGLVAGNGKIGKRPAIRLVAKIQGPLIPAEIPSHYSGLRHQVIPMPAPQVHS